MLFMALPWVLVAQQTEYSIKSFLEQGVKAQNSHHSGEAWLNFLLQEEDGLSYNITQATFKANATLDWHKHSTPQVLIVLEGKGYYQERGKDAVIMKKGDIIQCEKDTEHWHTSSKNTMISYLAIYGSSPTQWTEKMSQEYYDDIAKSLEDK